MSAIEFYRKFTEELFKEYKELGLKTLADHEFSGKSAAALLSEILRKKNSVHPLPYSDFKLHDELNFISKDLKFCTGMLHILRPYINSAFRHEDTYHQTLEDSRYLMYANFALQSIYNFWDRLGDILFLYFFTGLKSDQVFFGRVVNNLEPKYQASKPFESLRSLYDTKVKTLVDNRHETVHHYQLECKHYWANIEFRHDKSKLAKLNEEKRNYGAKIKEQLELLPDAFFLTMQLIDELPDKE